MTEPDPDVEGLLREAGRNLNEAYKLTDNEDVEQKIKSGHGSVSAAVQSLREAHDGE